MTVHRESLQIFSNLSALLGGASIRLTRLPRDLGDAFPTASSSMLEEGGCLRSPNGGSRIYVWVALPTERGKRYDSCALERRFGTFSDSEVALCDEVTKGASIIWEPFAETVYPAHVRTAVNYGAMIIGISRYLRADYIRYWSTALLISLVQQLTFRRYEGKACTSGFLCLQPSLEQGAQERIRDSLAHAWAEKWTYKALPKGPVVVDGSFFKEVGSFRYVDGVNSIYVATAGAPFPRVRGVIGLKDMNAYSLTEKASHRQWTDLLQEGETFIACANRNSEVDVVSRKDDTHFLRWCRGDWRLVNTGLIRSALSKYLGQESVATQIVQAVLTLSQLRYGTLILVPTEQARLPDLGGRIDRSQLGEAVRHLVRGQSLDELMRTGQFVNVLASDGLTIVSSEGKIIDTGVIIRLRGGSAGSGGGGGRTAAALTASRYGVAVKVSADGPMSLFISGREVYRTARLDSVNAYRVSVTDSSEGPPCMSIGFSEGRSRATSTCEQPTEFELVITSEDGEGA